MRVFFWFFFLRSKEKKSGNSRFYFRSKLFLEVGYAKKERGRRSNEAYTHTQHTVAQMQETGKLQNLSVHTVVKDAFMMPQKKKMSRADTNVAGLKPAQRSGSPDFSFFFFFFFFLFSLQNWRSNQCCVYVRHET
jgi:hypothetical protein